MKTRIRDLPPELLREILLWLPADSLSRCSCVRRSWRRVVKTIVRKQNYVAEHLKRSRTRPTLLVSAGVKSNRARRSVREQFRTISSPSPEFCFVDSFTRRSGSDFLKNFRDEDHCCYTYHCDGLVCIYNSRRRREFGFPKELVLLNPSVGRYKVIKGSSVFPKSTFRFVQHVAFGRDAVESVYKLVRVMFCGGRLWFAEVRTFGSGDWKIVNGWRKIEVLIDYFASCFPRHCQQVSCNGVYYWFTNVFAPILSFDFHSETFRPVPLPQFDQRLSTFSNGLSRLLLLVWRDDQVVLLKYHTTHISDQDDPKPMEMWVLEGSGWKKFLTIPPLDEVYRPLFFWNKDELILETLSHPGNEFQMASYNVATKIFRKLQGIAKMAHDQIYYAPYVPSLVWFR